MITNHIFYNYPSIMKALYSTFALLFTGLAYGQAPTTAPPTPEREAETVISIYSDAYEDTELSALNAEWSVATFMETTIADNAVLQYDNLEYAGIEMVGEDLALDLEAAGMTTLHFDYWSPNVTSFQIKLVDFGGDGFEPQDNNTESPVYRSLPQGEWVSVDLPLGLFTGMNLTDITQIVIAAEPVGTSTVYLDNIYFYSGGEVIGETPLDLPVTFEDETVTYALSDFGGAASRVIIDPTDEDNHVAETTKTAGALTYAGTTLTLNKGGSPNDPGFATALPFTEEARTVTVRVWSPTAGTPVRLKVEDSANANVSVETEATTTEAMAWETLTFDFNDVAAGPALDPEATYNKMSIFFDFGSEPTEDATYYWDDVYFGDATVGTRAPRAGILAAYPNPVAERTLVTAPVAMTSLTVYDAGGRQLATYRPGSERFNLPMDGLRSGVYFVLAETADGAFTLRLRKQ